MAPTPAFPAQVAAVWGSGLGLPWWLPLTAAAWLGACLGSFANVLVYRLPRNLSVVGPRSFCPCCRATVAWYDNVPLLSWCLLRARCRRCGARIPVRYFLLELAGGLSLMAGVLRFGFNATGAGAGLFLLAMVAVALIDWEHMIIPHTLTIAVAAVGLAAAAGGPPGTAVAAWGAVAGAGVVLAVSLLYRAVRGVPGMGGGDVMLMGAIGTFVGPWGVPAVLFAGALLGTAYAFAAGRGAVAGSAKLPFGTFLAAAAVVVRFWGDPLFAWYLGAF